MNAKRLALLLALPVIGYAGYALAQGTTVLSPATTTVTAGATATMAALAANPSRRMLTICNGSATLLTTFTTGPSTTPVSLTTGVVLQTGNVAASCITLGTGAKDGPAVGAQINIISSTGGDPVTFIEYY